MKSIITGGETEYLFKLKILNKYDVSYFRCIETGFIQTESAYWLSESYSSAITDEDTGICVRNEEITRISSELFSYGFSKEAPYVDFGGGYGLYVRMMRDRGYNFYLYDKYAQNIFAKNNQISDLSQLSAAKAEFITAFEVLEHLNDPTLIIKELLNYTDNILFSTLLVPDKVTKSWWYFAPNHGQHVSFYTEKSLEYIASLTDCKVHCSINRARSNPTLGIQMHLFTRKDLKPELARLLKPQSSLLEQVFFC